MHLAVPMIGLVLLVIFTLMHFLPFPCEFFSIKNCNFKIIKIKEIMNCIDWALLFVGTFILFLSLSWEITDSILIKREKNRVRKNQVQVVQIPQHEFPQQEM